MQFAIVQGTVVATQKVKELTGLALKVIQPCSPDRAGKLQPVGDAIVAVDSIGARDGDSVLWVGKREASLAIPGSPLSNNYPVDAAITGIIDAIG